VGQISQFRPQTCADRVTAEGFHGLSRDDTRCTTAGVAKLGENGELRQGKGLVLGDTSVKKVGTGKRDQELWPGKKKRRRGEGWVARYVKRSSRGKRRDSVQSLLFWDMAQQKTYGGRI